MTVLATSKIGQNFRLTLPQEVRDFLEVDEGTELVFYTRANQPGRVCIRKM